jgi:hypothetical protein
LTYNVLCELHWAPWGLGVSNSVPAWPAPAAAGLLDSDLHQIAPQERAFRFARRSDIIPSRNEIFRFARQPLDPYPVSLQHADPNTFKIFSGPPGQTSRDPHQVKLTLVLVIP